MVFFSVIEFFFLFFFFQAEDGIRDPLVTGVQTCALPISSTWTRRARRSSDRISMQRECISPPLSRRGERCADAGRRFLQGGSPPPSRRVLRLPAADATTSHRTGATATYTKVYLILRRQVG